MSNVKPLGNRLLVRRKKAATSKGGILLPESAQEKPKEGEVIAVGPGSEDQPMNVQIGDHVLFGGYAGVEVKSENTDEELLILKEDEVLGVLATN